jgi:hypothetical protein
LTYGRVTSEFSSYVSTLFDGIERLRKVTFVGTHHGQQVIKVWLTRGQYTELQPRSLEEQMGAFKGKFMNALIARSISEKALEQKLSREQRRLYRAAFSRLPAEQVQLAAEFR